MKNIWLGMMGLMGLVTAGCGGGGSSPSANIGPAPVQAVTFTTGQNASVVIGQSNFTTGTGGAASASTIYSSYGNPSVLNGVLYIGDYGHNRVLGFNVIPAANGAAADFVLGQSNFSNELAGSTLTTMYHPQTTVTYNGELFVDEYGNNRIDVYDQAPSATTSAPAAATPEAISFIVTASALGGLRNCE